MQNGAKLAPLFPVGSLLLCTGFDFCWSIVAKRKPHNLPPRHVEDTRIGIGCWGQVERVGSCCDGQREKEAEDCFAKLAGQYAAGPKLMQPQCTIDPNQIQYSSRRARAQTQGRRACEVIRK